MVRRFGVRARWAVPAGAAATVGIVIAASAVASASVPSLPHRTAAQLLAEAAAASGKPLGPLTATVQQTVDLGLPQLPQVGQPGATSGLAAGTQSITIWYRDPQHIRIEEPVQAGETDLRLDGRTLWLWNSKTQTATRLALPAHATRQSGQAGNGVAPGTSPNASPAAGPSFVPESPLAAASQLLKAIGPSTVVGVQSNVYVAGRPAYQIALMPRSGQSLVGKILIAIDASRRIPLRVEVFGRGAAGLAYSIGFSSLSFGTPAASNFSFTPPPGATVKKQTVPANLRSPLGGVGLGPAGLGLGRLGLGRLGLGGLGLGRLRVGPAAGAFAFGGHVRMGKFPPGAAIPKQALAAINARFAQSLPASMTKVQRAKAIKMFDQRIMAVKAGKAHGAGGFFTFRGWRQSARKLVKHPALKTGLPPGQAGAAKVIGTGWLSVVATPANPQVAAAVQTLLKAHGRAPQSPFGGSSSSAASSALSVSGSAPRIRAVPFGPNLAVLRTLLLATTPVHGSWGSGRLLQTKLLSVLITSKGQILAGAVTPAVLYADVAADAG
jgi:outer membrane lipoprotein-sorting protein